MKSVATPDRSGEQIAMTHETLERVAVNPPSPDDGRCRLSSDDHGSTLHPEEARGGTRQPFRPPSGGVLTGPVNPQAQRLWIDPA